MRIKRFRGLFVSFLVILLLLPLTPGRPQASDNTPSSLPRQAPETVNPNGNLKIAAVPTQIAFQGFLTDDQGAPIDGAVDIQVRLWDASSGGTLIWGPESHSAITVSQGVFQLALGGGGLPLDPNDFSGTALYLGIEVNAEAEMPRTQLLASPYAMLAQHALTADVAVGDDGDWTISGDDIAHLTGRVGIGVLPSSKLVTEQKPGEEKPLALPNDRKLTVEGTDSQVIYANIFESVDNPNGRAAIYGLRNRSAGPQHDGTDYSVVGTNNAITGYNFWGDQYSFGVAGYSYNDDIRTAGVLGSDHAGSYWGALGYKDENGIAWGCYTPNHAYVGGRLTIGGATNAGARLQVEQDLSSVAPAIAAISQDSGLLSADGRSTIYGERSGSATENNGMGYSLQTANSAITGYNHGTVSPGQYSFGVAGFSSPGGHPTASILNGGVLGATANGQYWCALGYVSAPGVLWGLYTNKNAYVGGSLTIGGGADIVEGFESSDEDMLEAGTVVVIDPQNAGALMQSTEAYDPKVAGVVSGANGVEPGIQLGHASVLDGDTKVAMTGRVYVKCSTENGPIRPGDRLTTASLPGHAMKATDAGLCDGAVIGKAMSLLDDGTGFVLVLVNLQ